MGHIGLLSIQKQSFVLLDKYPSSPFPGYLLLLPHPLSPAFVPYRCLLSPGAKKNLCAENLVFGYLELTLRFPTMPS